MRAYSQFYLEDSMRNLAGMFDYAVRGLNYYPDDFFSLFIDSGVASLYEHGNPRYVCGLSGIELCQNVLGKTGKDFFYVETDKSFDGPEYWCGWSLAYYQWYSAFKFKDLREYGLLPSEILKRYILHEADISKFVEANSSFDVDTSFTSLDITFNSSVAISFSELINPNTLNNPKIPVNIADIIVMLRSMANAVAIYLITFWAVVILFQHLQILLFH